MSQEFHLETEQRLNQLAQEWAAAERHGDTTFMERILADDFVAVGPRGFVLTKADWLQRYASGDLKHETFAWEDVTVRVFGDAAILIGRETESGTYQNHPIQGQFRTTLMYVRQRDSWLLAGLHQSPIAPPPGQPS